MNSNCKLKTWSSFSIVLLLLLLCVSFTGCGKEAKTSTISGCYAIDVTDINALTGHADNVFVGKVMDKLGESEDAGMVQTQYQVQVLENIKGNLITDKPIQVDKSSGYSEKEHMNSIYEGDFLPEEGDICIFYAYVQSDKSLLVSGQNSNTKLKAMGNLGDYHVDYSHDKNYKRAVKAVDTQTNTNRQRLVSRYEEK